MATPDEDNPGELIDLDTDPEAYGAEDAVADGDDHLAVQTDNSGEDAGENEDAPQGSEDVADDDVDDDGEPDDGE